MSLLDKLKDLYGVNQHEIYRHLFEKKFSDFNVPRVKVGKRNE